MADKQPSKWASGIAKQMPRRRLQSEREADVAALLDEVAEHVRRSTAIECSLIVRSAMIQCQSLAQVEERIEERFLSDKEAP